MTRVRVEPQSESYESESDTVSRLTTRYTCAPAEFDHNQPKNYGSSTIAIFSSEFACMICCYVTAVGIIFENLYFTKWCSDAYQV